MSYEHGVWLDYVEVVKITNYIKTNGFHCAGFENKDLFRVDFSDHELHSDHLQLIQVQTALPISLRVCHQALCFK